LDPSKGEWVMAKNGQLPPPHELVAVEEPVKVTIYLNRTIVNFFKKEAKKNHTKYQKLIRTALEKYSRMYS
jgi:hypothetical protein